MSHQRPRVASAPVRPSLGRVLGRALASAVGLVALAASPAAAEVPMHNPGLDSTCPPGFQYSRDTASCKQANCPPGAGRVYTLECNCGEAWGKAFRTCYENGLATHCVAAGAECKPGDSGGFDPLTGQCQVGYALEADGTCAHALPKTVVCKVLDADGAPLADRDLTFGESRDPKSAYVNTQTGKTGADGTVSFGVADPKSYGFIVKASGPEGLRSFTATRDAFKGCVLRMTDERGLERTVRDGYERLLRDACVGADDLAKVRQVGFDFSGGGKPLFDPSDGIIHGLSASDDFDETLRATIHELSHGMIAKIIDPSKDVGGPHNNWVPVDPAKVKGSHGTPESLAFEEAAADFVAMLYFRSRGEVYQADLADDTAAGHAIEANGKAASARTESVITRYLWSVYEPIIEGSPDGPARALADFLQTMNHAPRQASWGTTFTDPVRTIHELIATRVQRDGVATERAGCGFAPVDLERARRLADAYGLVPVPRTQSPSRTGDDLAALTPGDHAVPAGSALTFQDGAHLLDAGKLGAMRLGGAADARYRVEGDGLPTLLDGTAAVRDGAARTDALDIIPTGTGYVVRVAAGTHTVAVDHGAVEVVERGGAGRRAALAAGQAVDFTASAGFAAVREARADLARAAEVFASPRRESGGAGAGVRRWLAWVVTGMIAVALVIAGAALVRRRRGRRSVLVNRR